MKIRKTGNVCRGLMTPVSLAFPLFLLQTRNCKRQNAATVDVNGAVFRPYLTFFPNRVLRSLGNGISSLEFDLPRLSVMRLCVAQPRAQFDTFKEKGGNARTQT